ncbi:hypothetical protein HDU93_001731, partial [Gonapodya sp. JEL0774]
MLTPLRTALLIVVYLALFAPPVITSPVHRRHEEAIAKIKAAYAIGKEKWDTGLAVNVFNSSFYANPKNWSAENSKPGQLLKFEQISRSSLDAQYGYPPGMTLFRMLYTSTDIALKVVPASAFILLPFTAGNSSVFKSLVWAHGTSGITRDCAPSLLRSLYYDFSGPFSFALAGFAVIGVDYAGEGSDTQFNYVAGASHGDDVSYGFMAAKKTPIGKFLSNQWAVIGHSEGGLSAWATNEREAVRPTPGFLGSVSVAPAIWARDPIDTKTFDLDAIYKADNGTSNITLAKDVQYDIKLDTPITDTGLYYVVYTFESIARLANSSFKAESYYTPEGLATRDLLLKGGCYIAGQWATANATIDSLFKDLSWFTSTWRDEWIDKIGSRGEGKLAKPMLLVQSVDDEVVTYTGPLVAFQNNCALNKDSKILLSAYSGYQHTPTMYAAYTEYVAFLNALFANSTSGIPTRCAMKTTNPTVL